MASAATSRLREQRGDRFIDNACGGSPATPFAGTRITLFCTSQQSPAIFPKVFCTFLQFFVRILHFFAYFCNVPVGILHIAARLQCSHRYFAHFKDSYVTWERRRLQTTKFQAFGGLLGTFGGHFGSILRTFSAHFGGSGTHLEAYSL